MYMILPRFPMIIRKILIMKEKKGVLQRVIPPVKMRRHLHQLQVMPAKWQTAILNQVKRAVMPPHPGILILMKIPEVLRLPEIPQQLKPQQIPPALTLL